MFVRASCAELPCPLHHPCFVKLQTDGMGNHHVHVVCTSLNAKIFIVTFNNSDVLYWYYRELRHVARNKKIRVSGLNAGGYVKVGVIYGGVENNKKCFYDLFQVRDGSTLFIEAVSPVNGVQSWSVIPEGCAKLLDCGLTISLKPDSFQLLNGDNDNDNPSDADTDDPQPLVLRMQENQQQEDDAIDGAFGVDTMSLLPPLLPPPEENKLRAILAPLVSASRQTHPSLVPSECQADEMAGCGNGREENS
ncbi:uncharacterized protein LOC112567774 isoform X3 [Pomacea canaliculata]|uniref:uncharacterized protein LOC112567774 isoform X3 n=1 Tax=Pomacea canaliculata TaxID=400727 RepID=UPI000D7344FE|nr:uncharacterized protein LOC112567774 isoform X3 [Pomacea canaliculata]